MFFAWAALPQVSPQAADTGPRSSARKELLRLIDQLEPKLPRDVARKLIVVSIKLATGYCSPYAAREVEEAIEALPESTRKGFEPQWKAVRTHKCWPRMPGAGQEALPKDRAPT